MEMAGVLLKALWYRYSGKNAPAAPENATCETRQAVTTRVHASLHFGSPAERLTNDAGGAVLREIMERIGIVERMARQPAVGSSRRSPPSLDRPRQAHSSLQQPPG